MLDVSLDAGIAGIDLLVLVASVMVVDGDGEEAGWET